jgi:hypothetical protein
MVISIEERAQRLSEGTVLISKEENIIVLCFIVMENVLNDVDCNVY